MMNTTENIVKPSRLQLLMLFVVTLGFFLIGLSHQEIIRFDSRFYLFALEMQKYGLSWFPTTYHTPYPDYPATSTVLIVLLAKWFGTLNKLIAVLPTAIAAALTVMITYAIAATENARWGIFASCFLILNVSFLVAARSISLDMYPTLITTLCFYLLTAHRQHSSCYSLFALLILGFMFRGPIGLVIPTSVVCGYYLVDGKIRQCIKFGIIAALLLLICMAILLALAYHTGGITFMHDVWRMEAVGRINEKALPVYFYFVNSFSNGALAFPCAFLVILAIIYNFFKRPESLPHAKLIVKLIVWIAIVMVGMSIPGDKKARYILPIMPAIALLAAYPFVFLTKEGTFARLRQVFSILFFIMPYALFIGLLVLQMMAHRRHITLPIAYFPLSISLIFFQGVNIIGWLRNQSSIAIISCMVATLSWLLIFIGAIEPALQHLNASRKLVQQIENLRAQAAANLVFYREGKDGLPIKYLVNTKDTVQPDFIADLNALQQYQQRGYFVASLEYFTALPKATASAYTIVKTGNLGHTPIVVFTNIK